ncbi:nucleoside hydrolase [Nanchangia anserum]|uniref:Nucleoside hydrolase n=1 Tax=Nanchangia anserum TaxID=2692125 RepID=A0A8I0GB48_9ACTO|nr:nucleoside hydrolase [Nanchangia anserum]MBD3688915.1 nucleoside hydrolase [Nanchangia anserum]QOX81179.1 nucleoside hydrolase [Nanchangia anserum]
MSARSIILDCDPGHDDAVAIMLALGNDAIDLRAITTVGGNQVIDKVTYNAQAMLAACGREDVPVYRGASRPLLREVEVADEIHGETGLDGVELPQPSVELAPGHAVEAICRMVREAEPGELMLVATGPLTNLALAVRLEPSIVERVREVVIMGGGYHEGNWSAVAEFNIAVDPEAAAIVFAEKWPLTMVGLDLTHQALATSSVEEKMAALDTELSRIFLGLMAFFREAYRENQGFTDPPVHDPCTIAYLIDPSIVATRKAPVSVETRGELTCGMTVTDLRAPAPPECHTQVATHLDADRFWDLVIDAVRALGEETA